MAVFPWPVFFRRRRNDTLHLVTSQGHVADVRGPVCVTMAGGGGAGGSGAAMYTTTAGGAGGNGGSGRAIITTYEPRLPSECPKCGGPTRRATRGRCWYCKAVL